MIDLHDIHPCQNKLVDGQLDDGRLVELKARIPRRMDKLIPFIVAMANAKGGMIIFGIDNRYMSIVGIAEYSQLQYDAIADAIETLSIGVMYSLTHEVIKKKDVLTLEIMKSQATAFFSRVETSPARQIAYFFKEDHIGQFNLVNESEMRYSKVYKYMTLEGFLASLYSGQWRFSEPSKWNDKYEQRFYCANYAFPSAIGNTPQLFATCVTKAKNSEAAWKVYSHGQGLGAHCVQLELDIVELRKQLRSSGFRFEERSIVYKKEEEIQSLHLKSMPSYKEYFSSFSINAFLHLLSIKRDAFSYEEELRLFIIPGNGGTRNKGKKAKDKDLKINWRDVIKKVRVDKKCTPGEMVSIQSACFEAGINPVVTDKNYKFLGKRKGPSHLKNIEFDLFDIDDMPGTKSITIL